LGLFVFVVPVLFVVLKSWMSNFRRFTHVVSSLQIDRAVDAVPASIFKSATEKLSVSPVDNDTLAEVQRLYHLTEDQAITRLAAEVEAADLYRRVKSMELIGYPGAWFDPQTLKLNVALAELKDVKRAEKMGASVVRVNWSMKDLEAVVTDMTSAYPAIQGAVREMYIDPQMNRVVVAVDVKDVSESRAQLSIYQDRILIVAADEVSTFNADIRGGDGIKDYQVAPPDAFHCSVGASTANGFFTAGHCVNARDEVFPENLNEPLGTVIASAYDSIRPFRDTAWVQAEDGWFPKAKVNGYSQGIISIPAKWSGVSAAPINTTACRYGQTSSGPHCGKVSQIGVLIQMSGGERVKETTKVQGSCSNDGDSGGTWLSAGDYQIQGTNIGGDPTGTCPGSASWTYFQPIAHHISAYNSSAGSVLTAHGARTATVSGYLCPDPAHSGGGTYICRIANYNSQGRTFVNWSSSTTVSWFTDDMISGTCNNGTMVTVNLAVNNPYGTYTRAKSFACPTGPVP
jgi:streptogrisin C